MRGWVLAILAVWLVVWVGSGFLPKPPDVPMATTGPGQVVIKVPGMSYQPPLIGTKQLLNFTASSWPAAGGWFALAAMMLAIVAVVLAWRTKRVRDPARLAALASAA